MKENLTEQDLTLIQAMQDAAVSYCVGQTGLTKEEMDEHEDITIADLTLISDMWDNRSMSINRSNINRVIDTILGMHCINLLPTPDEEAS